MGSLIPGQALLYERSNGANNLTLNGIISGSGFGVTKVGAGTLTLGGSNTYTGATTINAGTVALTGKIYCPTSACNTSLNPAAIVTVTSEATLELTNWEWLGSFGSNFYDKTNLVIDGGTLKYSGLADDE